MKKFAFTLAEVLITLTIIGIIAALTIPNLSRKWRDHADVQRFKEGYSILNNAYQLAIREYGLINEWQWPSGTKFNPTAAVTKQNDMIFFLEQISPYLKTQKGCNLRTQNCRYWWSGYTGLPLANGMTILTGGFYIRNDGIMTDGFLAIDINGKKTPNRIGLDQFLFFMNGYKSMIPRSKAAAACDIKRIKANDDYGGLSCAWWILRKGNMDYKYRDVSAEW